MANILIVEDDLEIRTLFGFVLQRHHEVREAATAKEADAIWHQHHIDLVVVDVVLPGGRSGTDFALPLIEARPEVRFLYVSGLPIHRWRQFDRENLERMPAWSFAILEKPFLPDALEKRVRELLADRKTRTA